MTKSSRSVLFPLHIHIGVLFTLLMVISGVALGWFNYAQNTRMIHASAEQVFDRFHSELQAQIAQIDAPMQGFVQQFSYQQINMETTLEGRLQALPYISEAMNNNRQMASVLVGYENGDFFSVWQLRTPESKRAFGAPEGSAFLAQSVAQGKDGAPASAIFIYFDQKLSEIRRDRKENYSYDPRARIWYKTAIASDKLARTEPYVFFSTGELGVTMARRSQRGQGVVGVDMALSGVSDFLSKQRITPSTRITWFSDEGRLFASDRPIPQGKPVSKVLPRIQEMGVPVLKQVYEAYARNPVSRILTLNDGSQDWKVSIMVMTPMPGVRRGIAIATPLDELLAEANRIRNRAMLITALIVLLTVPLTWGLSHLISRQLRGLAAEARLIQEFRFDESAPARSSIQEIDLLGRSMEQMKLTIHKFLDISAMLAAEQRFERLLERVLEETVAVATASGGVIFLLDDDTRTLHPAACRNTAGNWDCKQIADIPLTLRETEDDPVRAAIRNGTTQVSILAAGARSQLPAGLAFCAPMLDAEDATLIVVPLRNRQHQAIGLLCLIKTHLGEEEKPGIKRELVAFIEALSGSSAIAIDNQRLLQSQRDLLDAFIRLIAGAIDAKSAYTGGHCQRVPVLTQMLARAACEVDSGSLRDFTLNDDEWEELRIASWLHDCGKVTTPEYVVDKATKLETLYDRIHEIRMRFEVLKRDAEIESWRTQAQGADSAAAKASLDATWRELDNDFAFVATCNEGGEFMNPEALARIRQIAARTWQRTLDDRIGISHEELVRKQTVPPPTLPCTEPLLADRPDHIIRREARDSLPADNPWGFRLDTPAHLYNKGELYNLCIGRGTLSEEERFKINDHIVQTVIMLSQLPFPAHLKRVPEIAGGHHEKMDGTGYPRRLHRDEMSWSARMMAIADIFEALTAVDRPYKKGKTLSEALKIMSFMRRDQHIDPELFALFLTSGVYLEYARQFLRPEQIDEVDVAVFLV
jgi:HD-GYP domain-containing protein (c-di-GMP phosphodiesterase class II)